MFEDIKRDSLALILIFTRITARMPIRTTRLVAELTWNTFRNHLILEYEISKYDGE